MLAEFYFWIGVRVKSLVEKTRQLFKRVAVWRHKKQEERKWKLVGVEAVFGKLVATGDRKIEIRVV